MTATTPTLTDDQRRLLAMLGAGLTQQQAARRFGVTEPTLRRRLHRIYQALDANTAAHAVAIAMRHGLIYASPNRRTTQ